MLSTFASPDHSLSTRSVTCCLSSRHRGQPSDTVTVADSSRSDSVFTKTLLSILCLLVFKRLLGHLDWFSHLRFRVAMFLAATYIDPICTPRHSSSLQLNICNTSWSVLATAAKSFNSLDNLRAITPDALLTESSAQKPETACNSLSLPPPRSHEEIDRRSAVILADT